MNSLPITEGSPIVGFLTAAVLAAIVYLTGWWGIGGLIIAFALLCAFIFFDACDHEPDTDLRIVHLTEQDERPVDR